MLAHETGTVNPQAVSRQSRVLATEVSDVQRARILAAAVETVDELGYIGMTVAQISERARVSRKTFYDVFADREDCFLAAFEHTHSRVWQLAGKAIDRESRWSERIRLALATILMFVEDEPALARLWVVEALGAGDRVLRRRARALDEFAEIIDEGRMERKNHLQPSSLTALALVGGVVTLLHGELLRQRKPATDMLNSLMSVIVLPYLGQRASLRELARPSMEISRRPLSGSASIGDDPLSGLNMRVTHRTARVLMAIAQSPGASNRSVAESAGVVDQGQISKLLSRVAGLGLIENRGAGQERGRANAWHLTPRGLRVERATRPL
jgi:AcrR family transcriptional regulator